MRSSVLVLAAGSAFALSACDSAPTPTAPAADASPTAEHSAPKKDAKAAEKTKARTRFVAAARTGYELFRRAKKDEWPSSCPKLPKTSVLLLPSHGALSVLGSRDQKTMKHAFLEQTMTPAALVDFPRQMRDLGAAKRLAKTTHIAFVQVTDHEEGKRVDDKTARSGTLGGWVAVVDITNGKGLCRFSLKAKNSPWVLSSKMTKVNGLDALNTQGLSADLAQSFARTLAAHLDKTTGAVLVDETGPVASSERYAPAKEPTKNKP